MASTVLVIQFAKLHDLAAGYKWVCAQWRDGRLGGGWSPPLPTKLVGFRRKRKTKDCAEPAAYKFAVVFEGAMSRLSPHGLPENVKIGASFVEYKRQFRPQPTTRVDFRFDDDMVRIFRICAAMDADASARDVDGYVAQIRRINRSTSPPATYATATARSQPPPSRSRNSTAEQPPQPPQALVPAAMLPALHRHRPALSRRPAPTEPTRPTRPPALTVATRPPRASAAAFKRPSKPTLVAPDREDGTEAVSRRLAQAWWRHGSKAVIKQQRTYYDLLRYYMHCRKRYNYWPADLRGVDRSFKQVFQAMEVHLKVVKLEQLGYQKTKLEWLDA